MFNNYNEYRDSTASEKILLVHLQATTRLYNFVADGDLFSREAPHFVDKVSNGYDALTRVDSLIDLDDATKFFFDIATKKLYLFEFDTMVDEVIVSYRLFLSSLPINLSWDLQDLSLDVEYSPRIQSAPVFKSEMTQGRKGINLIGKGSLVLDNTDGYFDDIYDTLIFENKTVDVYSYNRELAPSESVAIFRGTITSKSFSSNKVTFGLTDDLYALDSEISGNQFGDVVVDNETQFKRKVFGQVQNMRVQTIDQSRRERPLTGTIKVKRDSKFVVGIGTIFLTELSVGDTFVIDEIDYEIKRVLMNDYLELSDPAQANATLSVNFFSDSASPQFNREFHVADHALKRWETTSTSITARNRVGVVSTQGFKAGDIVTLDGTERKTIKRVSGNTIVLTTSLNLPHSDVGTVVTKDVVSSVSYSEKGSKLLFSDITVNNEVAGCTITLDPKAEINASSETTLNSKITFIKGYRKAWLGQPVLVDVTCLAHSSAAPLFSKYFTLKDDDGDLIVFYYSDDFPLEASSTIPPSLSNNEYPIILENRDYTAAEIATVTLRTIVSSTDIYEGHTDSTVPAKIHICSVEPIAMATGSAGTSGFTYSYIQNGIPTDSRIDLSKLVASRDFIQSVEDSSNEFFEVLEADQTYISLREPYTGDTNRSYMVYKSVEYIGDNTPVYVDCLGMTKDGTPTGEPILTVPEVVKWVLENRRLGSYINSPSFVQSSLEAAELVSFMLPYKFGDDKMPKASDAINKLNQTVIGSLFINEELLLGYNILDASRDIDTLQTISDDDVVSWTLKADAFDISREVIADYRHQDYLPALDDSTTLQVNHTSEFVDKYVGNNKTRRTAFYMFDTEEAQAQVERDELFTSLSNGVIQVKGSLNLSRFRLGERVVLNFSRLHKVLGTNGSLQIGIITSVNNTGEKVDLDIESLGALYARAAIVSEDSGVDDFEDASTADLTVTSFILDDDEIIGDDESTFNTSLIS